MPDSPANHSPLSGESGKSGAGSRERPILFSGPMVRAILAGTKTQTRRVMTPQPRHAVDGFGGILNDRYFVLESKQGVIPVTASAAYRVEPLCPYGVSGDRLWVREAWGIGGDRLIDPCLNYPADGAQRPVNRHKGGHDLWYPCDSQQPITSEELLKPSLFATGWRPSIHMPRWASRITLEITGVRVERVQEISAADARAEGMESCTPADQYRVLWDSINGKRPGCAWADNPWVWVVEFKRLEEKANAG